MERIIRRFAGSFILLSLLLAHYHSRYWLWLTAFVGLNLLQSSFTGFCPLERILQRCGVGSEKPSSQQAGTAAATQATAKSGGSCCCS
ncbi:MAG: DUF2892 domain-containing protein [Verrucomicrobiota bacterium]|nr:DUF2892 domain-containing protein [Limisphaera sp.]MDW8381500.1 DUF2892 domain-containing protein [Verrucomicrobiota bacterium]